MNANRIPSFDPIEPLQQEAKNLCHFPTDCLPADINEYVKALAAHSQTDEGMAGTAVLGILATALQGKYRISINNSYSEPLNLYTIVVAKPGERKSSVITALKEPLELFERKRNEEIKPLRKEYRRKKEELEREIASLETKALNNLDKEINKKLTKLNNQLEDLQEPQNYRMIADDVSNEKLSSLIQANNGRMSVISSEGGIFSTMSGQYSASGKSNYDIWLKAYSGDSIRVDRIGRESESIISPALSTVLAVQPMVLEEIMENESMKGRGLLGRFLYSFPESKIGKREFGSPSIPEEIQNKYTELIQNLCMIENSECKTIRISEQAFSLLASLFKDNEMFMGGEGEYLSDWLGKFIGNVSRIAGIIHIANGYNEADLVNEETMRNAINIGKYFLSHAQYTYSIISADIDILRAKHIINVLKEQKTDAIKRNDLFRKSRWKKYIRKITDIEKALDILEDKNIIHITEPVRIGAGRPADKTIYVNPELYDK